MRTILVALLLTVISCAPAGPATQPNEREWALLNADYQWIQTLRNAQKQPASNATRKERIELLLENHRKLEPTYVIFVDKLREYFDRTGDTRAGALLGREKVLLGDDYMNVLSRYDRAIDLYREALELDPSNPDATRRIAMAEQRRYVSMSAFAALKNGMTRDQVRQTIGVPREDWIKQVVQNGRAYSVWIYPKADGGAAAVYFDNDLVYHTNWNAAAPPANR